ncbi:hypothetical protein SN15_09375 [Stenotrophomonas maltophilia]|nr:hypothetical protein SN15_09375 [Stenotrophomonas maltophilia]
MPLSTSIAVCTYNGERFLQEQLDSLLRQTERPDQIVIRDDVSSDGTLDILRAFVPVAEAMGIVIDLQVNPANVGYRLNFDGALRACTGEVIFLCDQDDVWHADKLERFCAEFERRPDLLALHSDARLIDGEGRVLGRRLFTAILYESKELQRMHGGDGFALMLKRNLMTGAAMAFRRSLLSDALPLPSSEWVHDAWIGTLAAMRGGIDSLEEPSIDYRLHDQNQLGIGGNDPLQRSARRKRQLATERVQATLLLTRARALGVKSGLLDIIERKLHHVSVRGQLPASRLCRTPMVYGELVAGNYNRFGRGLLSAAIDLVRR